jgi:hypothetical protein
MKDPALWLGDLAIGNDGIVRRIDGRVAIGAVLLIENDRGEIVVVTKASKTTYEFSGRDVVPGGLLRSAGEGRIDRDDLHRTTIESLSARVAAEANFLLRVPPIPIDFDPPPTTSYTHRDARQYVVVLPYAITAPLGFSPVAAHASVTTARWADPLTVVPNLAPANCLIVCAFIWPRLDATARDACRTALARAAADCQNWAREAGVPPVDLARFC